MVVITAHSDQDLILNALENGAVEILKKPFRQKELRYLINKIEALFRERSVQLRSTFIDWEKRSIKFKNDIYLVPTIINFVFSNIDYISENDSLLRLGLQEIIINAIEHGNLGISRQEKVKMLEGGDYAEKLVQRAKLPPYKDRSVHMKIFSNIHYLKIIVEDMGDGFDTFKLPDVNDTSNFMQESGKGINVAMNAYDKIEYNEVGNVVTLIKHSGFNQAGDSVKYDKSDNFEIYRELSHYTHLKEQFDFELNLAAEFQNTFLPKKSEINEFKGIKSDYIYIPLLKVSGDFLDISKLEDGVYSYFISDISGHGVAAALISSMLKVFFSLYAKDVLSPQLLFEILNQEFFNYLNSGEYFTSFYGIYFQAENKFVFTNANHPPPLLFRKNSNEIVPLNSDGFFVGVFKDTEFEEKEVTLYTGDRILFYTDGIIEAKNAAKEEFGLERLKNIYLQEKSTLLPDLLKIIKYSVFAFTYGKIEDDIALAVIEIE